MRQSCFHFTSVIFLNAHDSFSDCPYPLDDFVRSQFSTMMVVLVVYLLTNVANECILFPVFCLLPRRWFTLTSFSEMSTAIVFWLPALLWYMYFVLALGNPGCYLVVVVLQQVQVSVQHLHFCRPHPSASLVYDQS